MERDPVGEQSLARVQARIRSELRATQQTQAKRAMDTALDAIPATMHPEKLATIPQSREGTVNSEAMVLHPAPAGADP